MRYAIVVVIISLPLVDIATGELIISEDTTLDFRIWPAEGPVRIIDGVKPPTSVDIVDGAEISPNIYVRGQSVLNLRGGITHSYIYGHDKAVINIFGGLVAAGEDVEAWDSSLVNIFGGTFGDDVEAFGSATVNLYGGSFVKAGDGATLTVQDDGIINVFGTHFTVTPVGEVFKRLTGILMDGTPIDVELFFDQENLQDGDIVLHTVPEMNSLNFAWMVLLIIGPYVVGRRRLTSTEKST